MTIFSRSHRFYWTVMFSLDGLVVAAEAALFLWGLHTGDTPTTVISGVCFTLFALATFHDYNKYRRETR